MSMTDLDVSSPSAPASLATTPAKKATNGGASGATATAASLEGVLAEESSGEGAVGAEATAADDQELSSASASESGEQPLEATSTEFANAESGEESAVGDLTTIEGFEGLPSLDGGESTSAVAAPLLEAGSSIETDPEFLPILASLVPTLISAVGPAVAKGVMTKLSPKAQKVVRRPVPRPPAGQPAGGSAALIAQILRLLQSAAAKPSGESAEAVDESLLTEAAAVLEVIIGNDDRVRITQTQSIPWRRICALRITFPSGSTFRGTGFFIGSRAVATAGHCVYMHNQGGWATKVEVIPGCNGASRPFGQAESRSFRSTTGWVQSRKPESDYGCIVLPNGAFAGKGLGSFGFAAFNAPTLLAQSAVIAGFPGDKPFAEMWGMARRIKTVTEKTLIYDIDTVGGQSGTPVYIKRNGHRYVVGIHNYGASTGNSATRVTKPVGDRLLAWSRI